MEGKREWLDLFSPVGTTRHGVWTADGVTGGHQPVLRRSAWANGCKHPGGSGSSSKQLRDGWRNRPHAPNAPRAGWLRAGTPRDAAGRAASRALLLPRMPQRFQEQAGHGAPLTHTHRGEALQVSLLPPQISYEGKSKGTHATHTHGHHHALLDLADGRKKEWWEMTLYLTWVLGRDCDARLSLHCWRKHTERLREVAVFLCIIIMKKDREVPYNNYRDETLDHTGMCREGGRVGSPWGCVRLHT